MSKTAQGSLNVIVPACHWLGGYWLVLAPTLIHVWTAGMYAWSQQFPGEIAAYTLPPPGSYPMIYDVLEQVNYPIH